jgi:hypothetical protein
VPLLHETELSGVIVCVLDSVIVVGQKGVADGVGVITGVVLGLGVGLGQPAPLAVMVRLQPPVIVPTSAPRSSTT